MCVCETTHTHTHTVKPVSSHVHTHTHTLCMCVGDVQDIAWGVKKKSGTQANVLPGGDHGSATCVQRFDDSLIPAIHTTYRISLRSSSSREPRYPLLGVVLLLSIYLLDF